MDRQRIGGVASLLLGFAFMWEVGSRIWGQQPGLLVTLAIFAAAVFGVLFVATILFRPRRTWTFPLLFSAPMVVFALLFFGDPIGLRMFGGAALAAFAVGSVAVFAGRIATGTRDRGS